MIDYRNIIKNRELRLKLINLLRFIPDEPYLKMVYWIKTGKKLNLKNPRTFCDKLNWLKLHNRRPEFTRMVDKVAVKEHLQEILGELSAENRKFTFLCGHDSNLGSVLAALPVFALGKIWLGF